MIQELRVTSGTSGKSLGSQAARGSCRKHIVGFFTGSSYNKGECSPLFWNVSRTYSVVTTYCGTNLTCSQNFNMYLLLRKYFFIILRFPKVFQSQKNPYFTSGFFHIWFCVKTQDRQPNPIIFSLNCKAFPPVGKEHIFSSVFLSYPQIPWFVCLIHVQRQDEPQFVASAPAQDL